MNDITNDYLNKLIKKNHPLYEYHNKQKEDLIATITDDTLQHIKVWIEAKKVQSILEVGTATGASSMFFASFIGENARILTIERDDRVYYEAKKAIAEKGFDGNIEQLHAYASEILESIDEKFDMIFLDGAKGQYIHMLDTLISKLNVGGILFADNVLFKGMVTGETPLIKRKITIVKRLRMFLAEISKRDELESSILPIGDGLSISIKKY